MNSPALSGRVYRFGMFEVDVRKRELLRRGLPVRLQDQPFRILCMLLEKPGEAVTREELRQALWPSDTFVAFDGSLNAALKRLRFALGDSARNPTFIITLPKHGYRFIAPVAIEESAGLACGASGRLDAPLAAASAEGRNGHAPGNQATQRGKSRRWKYLALAAAAIVLQQAVYWIFPLPPPRMINRTRLTHTGNVEPGPIVSDGTRIFFCARRGARRFPMQTSINGGDAVEVKTPFPSSTIFDISPDQTRFLLGSLDRIGYPYQLWVWPVTGGPPRRIGEFRSSNAVWWPDGRRIAFTSGDTLYEADSDGSGMRPLAKKPAYRLVWPPDGSRLTFSTWDPFLRVHSLWDVRTDGTHLEQLFPGGEKTADTSAGFWLAGGKYFAFLRGSFPHQKLWMTREQGNFWRRASRRPVLVSLGAEDTETVVGLESRGSRLVSMGYWPDTKLYRLSPDSHSRYTASFPTASNLHFSRDGRWVAYASTVDGSLWRCRTNGADCLQLTPAGLSTLEPRWSPDSRQILFIGTLPNVMRRLWTVAAEGGALPRALGPPDLAAGLADWSADGKQIILDMSGASVDAPDHLYLIDAASGKASLLPGSEGYHFPAWSRDGRLIAAINSTDNRIFFYSLRLKQWTPGPSATTAAYPYWSYRANELFYQDMAEAGQPIYRFDPASGKKELAFDFSEVLQKDAVTCRLAGIGLDDTLYAYAIGATTDLFAVDLDLP